MTIISVTPPFQTFKDVDGDPLDRGQIFIGEPGQSAEFFPKSAFWDAGLSVPATQPVETRGGFAMNGGTPGTLYVDGDYSITVKDRKGGLVQSSLNSSALSPHPAYTFPARADFIVWQQDNTATDGTIASDGTVLYVASAGATAIADMPGWLPFGQRRPAHDGLNTTVVVPDDATTMQEVIDRYGPSPVDNITIEIKAGHQPTSGIVVSNGDYSKYAVSSQAQATAFLYVKGSISVTNGETITQATSGATGTVESATGATQVLLLSGVSGTFDTTNELTGSTSGPLGANSVPRVSRQGAVIVPNFSGNFIDGESCLMPTLDCLVAGPGTSALFDGYYARNTAIGAVTANSGVLGAWSAGLRTFGASLVDARDTIWDCGGQSGTTGASCNIWGGKAYLDGVSAVWSGYYGVQAAHGGSVTVRNSDVSNAYRHGLRASDAAILDADGATANNCGRDGSGSNVRSFEGSKASFVGGVANGGFNCFFCSGGELNIKGATGTGASSVDLNAAAGVVYTDSSTVYTTTTVANAVILGSTKGNFQWGTYTPTASGLVNVTTITPNTAQWMRVGDTVTVSGTVNVVATAAASTATEFELSLPVASDLSGFSSLGGSGAATTQTTNQASPAGILGATANDTAEFRFAAQTTNTVVWSYTYTYRVE